MKKTLVLTLTLALALSLTACGGNSNDNSGAAQSSGTPSQTPPPASGQQQPASEPSSSPAESPSENLGGNSSGIELEYDPLYMFTDYIADQYAPFESAINEYINANPNDSASGALINEATACVSFSTIDGEKFNGAPVDKNVSGNITTWTVSGEASSFGSAYLFEQSAKLDKSTNTITGEIVKKNTDGTVTNREIIESVLLSDGTVLSAYFSYRISDNQTYTSANFYSFNAETGELLAYVGTMQDVNADFSPPSLVGAKDLDPATYNTFANLTATYTISGGEVDRK